MERRKILKDEWSPKNDKPFSKYTNGSNFRAWWSCEKSECSHPHEWEAFIYNRFKGQGCPFCAEKKICVCNSLAVLRPDLASEWHPIKNKNLKPYMFSVSSGKKVWWLCNKSKCEHPHEWYGTINHRNNGTGCPFCAQKQICVCNSLAGLRPNLASEWHPTKNKNLKPELVAIFSSKRVWWLCNKSTCVHPHEWQAIISSRVAGHNCPFCAKKQICVCNSLAALRPDIAAEWHPTKNKNLKPDMVSIYSNKKVWWLCNKSTCIHPHEWQATVSSRSEGHNCPFCARKQICVCNSLAKLRPGVAAEWHPFKNKNLTPELVAINSHKKAWWKCAKKSHQWKTTIRYRTRINIGTNCPLCSSSKGEKMVKEILDRRQISYIAQYRIGPRDSNPLRIDFYLPDHNLAIEFDGMQHFEPVDFFGGEEGFQRRRLLDLTKDIYCVRRKIHILRLHYLDLEDMENLIDFSLGKKYYGHMIFSASYVRKKVPP